MQPDYEGLRIDPCIPRDWPGFTATRVFRGATYHIRVDNPRAVSRGIKRLKVNGHVVEGPLALSSGKVCVNDSGVCSRTKSRANG